jgi:mRNA-degrading endonuclease RelE of RelBE toxin-antitoxin system
VRDVSSNPTAIAFKRDENVGYVTVAGIDQVIEVRLGANGAPTIGAPAPVRIPSLQGRILRGKQLFFAAIGPAGTDPSFPASQPPGGVMSDRGWGGCRSCHFNGWTDNVTWMFPDGPRQTISLDGMFDRSRGNVARVLATHRILNFSAIRDEVQDFDLNTRAVFGGQGLINKEDGTQNKDVVSLVRADGSLGLPNRLRNADLEALELYQAFGIRSRIAPNFSSSELRAGAALFVAAGCDQCHAGQQWTSSVRDFTPPPHADFEAGSIKDTQLVRFLKNVGTFDPNAANEVRANANVNGQVPGARRRWDQPALAPLRLRHRALPARRHGADPGSGAGQRDPPHRRRPRPGTRRPEHPAAARPARALPESHRRRHRLHPAPAAAVAGPRLYRAARGTPPPGRSFVDRSVHPLTLTPRKRTMPVVAAAWGFLARGMRFKVTLTPSADEDLAYFRAYERRIIAEAIEIFLGIDADQEGKRRKRLRPNPLAPWELRVDKYRVFYEFEGASTVKVVAIGCKEHNEIRIRGRAVDL